MENGKEKKISEKYLVDSLSVTEAEARIIEEMTPFISGEFEVKSVSDTKYSAVVPSENEADDIWYKINLSYLTLDEKTGMDKRVSDLMLFQASDIRKAIEYFDLYMKGTMADYIIDGVSDSKIVDVYKYEFEKGEL